MNTPCPDYRVKNNDIIDDTIVVDNEANTDRAFGYDVSCEVEIHDCTESSRDHQETKNLLDFDTDDENILSSLNVLVSDGSSLDLTPRRFAYPDANSHSNYNLMNDDTPSSDISRSRNLDVPVGKRNRNITDGRKISAGDFYHAGRVLSSENSDVNAVESCDDCSSYSVANSHLVYGILSEESEKTWDDMSRERLISFDTCDNYEIANSHSNYQVLYNRDDFIDWRTTYEQIRNEQDGRKLTRASDPTGCEKVGDFARSRMQFPEPESPRNNESESRSDSSKSTEETSTTCDIEDCLIQIEESLMNIEQNLLHVQELDIPELKSLLYESPMMERNVDEFPDILSMENTVATKTSNLTNNKRDVTDFVDNNGGVGFVTDRCNADPSVIDGATDEKRDNCDNEADILQFTDEFSVSENIEYSTSLPSSTRESIVYHNVDKNVNFIPNSLSKIPMRSIVVGETDDNILGNDTAENARNTRRRSLDDDIIDLINYNLNNLTNEKKFIGRNKCQSRTNSLDENSINRRFNLTDGANESEVVENSERESRVNVFGGICAKARSENSIGNLVNNACTIVREKSSNKAATKSRETRIAEVEAKAEEFRRMVENIVTNRCAIGKTGFDPVCSKNNGRNAKHVHKSSPKCCSVGNKNNEKDHDANRDGDTNSPSANKPYAYEKRKRKKLANRSFSGENALVPSKIISLSLSLLLAALLQAVRCLADLVEDAFKSVSFEKNGLLE